MPCLHQGDKDTPATKMEMGAEEMTFRPIGKKLDDILESLYDACDMSSLHRKYVGKSFNEELEVWVDYVVNNHVDSQPDHSNDIKDLEHRIAQIEETLHQIATTLRER